MTSFIIARSSFSSRERERHTHVNTEPPLANKLFTVVVVVAVVVGVLIVEIAAVSRLFLRTRVEEASS